MTGVDAAVKFSQYLLGLFADPLLAKWKAKRTVEANKILAHGHTEVVEILAKGEVRTSVGAMLDLIEDSLPIQERIERSIDQQVESLFEKRLYNLAQIAQKAMDALPSGEVPDVDPDIAWTSSFANSAQNISSEDMQEMWAKVLAGEVKHQGSTSIRTLGVLSDLDQPTAQMFKRLCSLSVSISILGTELDDHRVVSLEGEIGQNSLASYGLSYDKFNILNEFRLIHSDYGSWCDYRACIRPLPLAFAYQGRYWALKGETEWEPNKEFRLSGAALTMAGREQSKVVDLEVVSEYDTALKSYFSQHGLAMVLAQPVIVHPMPPVVINHHTSVHGSKPPPKTAPV